MNQEKRAPRRPRSGTRFERFLLSIMGPPSVGDPDEPIRDVLQPVRLCPSCGVSYDEHGVVRDPGLTYTRCPAIR